MLLMNSRQPESRRRWFKALLVLLVLLAPLAPVVLSAAEPVRFGRDVLPILSANCFACHGPDEKHRQAGLRLDVEADALRLRGHALQSLGMIAAGTDQVADQQNRPRNQGQQGDVFRIPRLGRHRELKVNL